MPIPIERQMDERTMPVPFGGCLIWMGSLTPSGYGKLAYNNRTLSAHKAAWEAARGSVPTGLFVCHKCNVPCCVNLDHLYLGAPQDNSSDMTRHGRQRYGLRGTASKLTPEAVADIRSAPGRTKALAARYGVSRTSIKKARNGDNWFHG